MSTVSTRPLRADDLGQAVDAQLVFDPDLDKIVFPSYAWDETRLRLAVRTFRRKGEPTKETRGLVAEVPMDVDLGEGYAETQPWVCGVAVYEMDEEGYHVRLLAAHHTAPSLVREALLDTMTSRAKARSQRQVSITVSDYDHPNLILARGRGMKLTLRPCGFDGFADAWVGELALAGPQQHAGQRA